MVDAQKLLDQFLGTGRGYGGPGTRPNLGQGAGSGGSVQDTLGKVLGGALGGTGARSGGGIGDILGSVLSGSKGGSSGGLGGGLAGKAIGGALAGGLASQLLKGKRGKGLGGSAVRLGGLALVAGLGYKAWQNYQAQQQAAGAAPAQGRLPPEHIPAAEGTPFHPAAPSEAETRSRLLLSAMIAAAKADGYIDRDEEQAIFGRIDDLELDAEEKGVLMDELRRPLSIDEIVARAGTPETAIEVYTASVLAIDADHPAERAYLDLLAARLNLAPELVAEIRRTADEAQA